VFFNKLLSFAVYLWSNRIRNFIRI